MVPHPYMLALAADTYIQQALAEAAHERRVAEARSVDGGGMIAAACGRLGVALVGLGTRLAGAYDVAPASSTSAAHAPHSAR